MEDINNISPEDMPDTEDNKNRNDGKWCKTFREALGFKQFVIADELKITQQGVSKLEGRRLLSDIVIETYTRVLGLPKDLIKNMPAFDSVSKFFYDQSQNIEAHSVQNLHFHPINKIVELSEEKDQLHREIIDSERKNVEQYKSMLDKSSQLITELTEMVKKVNNK